MTPPKTGMVLAAGFGTRLRPITDATPKPLVRIRGRALLDHAIDRLQAVGVEKVVVNTHYKAAQIAAHLAPRFELGVAPHVAPTVAISHEEVLLETGGGVVKALPLLDERFYVVNSDVFWLDGKVPALARLARAWDDSMDALLLLQRSTTAIGYDGIGDYLLDPLGVPRRRGERQIAPFVFAGLQILHRRLFDDPALPVKFSLGRLYDRAEETGRLRAIVHDGEWCHIGTPAALAGAEHRLAISRAAR
jgi:MurNAc alpha-1-phosphate uridylyltransferase